MLLRLSNGKGRTLKQKANFSYSIWDRLLEQAGLEGMPGIHRILAHLMLNCVRGPDKIWCRQKWWKFMNSKKLFRQKQKSLWDIATEVFKLSIPLLDSQLRLHHCHLTHHQPTALQYHQSLSSCAQNVFHCTRYIRLWANAPNLMFLLVTPI